MSSEFFRGSKLKTGTNDEGKPSMDPRCWIEMLGPLRLTQGGEAHTRFGSPKAESLLAFLALRLGPHAREQVIDRFWPDMDLPEGRNNLSTTLSGLRRLLEPPGVPKGSVLTATHSQIGLNPAAVSTDTAALEALLAQAAKTADPSTRISDLTAAAALYRGGFQPGNYADWAVREADRLEGVWAGALDTLAADLEALGRCPEAIAVLERRLAADPLAEAAQAALVRCLVQSGRTPEARRSVQRFEAAFTEEFGAAPDAAVRSALETLPAAPPPAETALPFWLSRFFGRDAALTQLAGLLFPVQKVSPGPGGPERPARLVTLTGPGGAGKTRLATEFGRLASERLGHGCSFVPLADLSAPGQIPARIASALGLPLLPAASPLEQVTAFFAGRRTQNMFLLILDNWEHLLEPHESGASLLRALLQPANGLVVLCTSRRRLGVDGERLVPLAPLPIPDFVSGACEAEMDLARLAHNPSVQLYLDRASAVRPDFGLTAANAPAVAALCRALEGSPLALELAASWVRLLPPRRMWERLEQNLGMPDGRSADLPERHRSLSAALEGSWRLLTAPAQGFMASLSVFRGGWTAEAAAAVCAEPSALTLLADLTDASLVVSAAPDTEGGFDDDPVRFRLLETVRAFCLEKLLGAAGGETLAARHAAYFGTLAVSASPKLRGPDQKAWLDRLDTDHDNLRAALAWHGAAAPPDTAESGLRLASALAPFWRARGYLREGYEQLSALLSRPSAAPPSVRAEALNRAGELACLLTAYPDAERLHAEARCLAQETGDAGAEADALLGLGTARYWCQDYPAAGAHFAGSLRRREASAGPEWHRAWGDAAARHSLANLALRQGCLGEAQRHFAQALAGRRRMGDTLGVAATVGGLGQTARAAGDTRAAIRHITEALTLFDQAGQRWTAALCLSDLSHLAEDDGNLPRAVRLLGTASALRRRFYFPQPPLEQAGNDERLAGLRGTLGDAAFEAAWSAGEAVTWEQLLADAHLSAHS